MKMHTALFQTYRFNKTLSWAGLLVVTGLLIGCQYLAPFDRPKEVPEILKVQQVKPAPPQVEEVVEDNRGLKETEYFPATGSSYKAVQSNERKQPGRQNKRNAAEIAPGKPEGKYTLNFDDADIGEVAKVILGDTLKLNYVINPKVTGKISLQTTAPLSDAEMIPTLETLLRMNGAALIKSDSIYRIEPDAAAIINAPNSGIGLTGKIQPGFQVRVVPLRFAGAHEMQKIVEPLLPPKSVVYADPLRNLLIVAANADDLENVKQTVNAFDVDFMRGMAVAFFPLQNVDPTTLAHELDALMMTGDKGAMSGMVRILPVERLNAVMAISAQPAYLRDVETWIERLDRFSPHKSGNMHVYKVQNVDAVTLAQTLAQVFGPAAHAGSGPQASIAPGMSGTSIGGGGGAAFGASNLQSSVSGVGFGVSDSGQASGSSSGGFGGGSSSGSSGMGGAAAASTGSSTGASPGSSSPASSSTTGSSGSSASGGFGAGSSGLGGAGSSGTGNRQPVVAELANNARVVADPVNNALVIFAKPAEFHDIETVLKELDVMPRQVIVDAMIAEVTLTGKLQYGLQWYFNKGSSSGGLYTPGIMGFPANFPVPDTAYTKNMQNGGFSYIFSANQIRAELDLLSTEGKVKILSTPSIMVLNNQEGQINVGQQVPVSNGQQNVTTGGIPTSTSTFSYRDTGVTLKLRPRVNEGGLVLMTVQQELVQPQPAPVTAPLNPPFLQRKIISTVAVNNGDTITMGGLIQENTQDTVTGIPVLAQLPYIGWLFGTTVKSMDRTELVMLLTPRTLDSRPDVTRVANEFRRHLTGWNDLKPLSPDPGGR
ncbi:type II secretion system protein GspD [Candidatus Methylospira mobilis]|uniref:Type II secretion system protein GspD n=1 Tax=Candidatus Methylospira mobilis TaxID=1808979 RepID=A0A5Q0BKH2_9GAMM|nr:type II secretion system secretin GspD [Candidatus Methylospira mobilis]QFY42266.1 type II secretion system protein GspD [Candidatus Methylospira mobilis]